MPSRGLVKAPTQGMRVLLVSANRETFPEPVFPLGAVYLAGALERAGATARIFDCNHLFPLAALHRVIAGFLPDAIGLSLRNLDNAAYPSVRFYIPSYETVVRSIRSVSGARIVLGGPALSLIPGEIAARLGADAWVCGEGDHVPHAFAASGGLPAADPLPGLNHVALPGNLRTVFPSFTRYRTVSIQTGRGCPNRCIYCTYPGLEGHKKRLREPAQVADDMALLAKDYGARNFFVVDSLFNADEVHMIRVLEEIVSRRLRVRFSCYLQPSIDNPDVFSLLRRAGCVAVDFGTDAGSPKILNALRKPFSVDDVVRASAACSAAGIDFCHSLLFGAPGENPDTIRETARLMDHIRPRAVVAMTGIRIYPGTQLQRIACEEGYINPGASLLEPKFYFGAMGARALIRTVYDAAAGRKNWFFPGEKDWSRSAGTKLLRFFYRGGPLWRTFRADG